MGGTGEVRLVSLVGALRSGGLTRRTVNGDLSITSRGCCHHTRGVVRNRVTLILSVRPARIRPFVRDIVTTTWDGRCSGQYASWVLLRHFVFVYHGSVLGTYGVGVAHHACYRGCSREVWLGRGHHATRGNECRNAIRASFGVYLREGHGT